ncbi:MAG: hypothetical protein IT450_14845 [Phycisphaerales bacterium]|nr:hypothetical protein [Phycisphaerales bacterium]
MARLFALLLLQARKDRATELRFDYRNGAIRYVVDESEYEMVPAPMPVFVDLLRALTKEARIGRDVYSGRFVLRCAEERIDVSVEHEWNQNLLRVFLPFNPSRRNREKGALPSELST